MRLHGRLSSRAFAPGVVQAARAAASGPIYARNAAQHGPTRETGRVRPECATSGLAEISAGRNIMRETLGHTRQGEPIALVLRSFPFASSAEERFAARD
ncbi:MAG TPA: hypothetical protein VMB03_25530 [Bryobacteraceae bacterium]|nr:hypothetical protein [Bryobacteraceae bacterium]